MTVRGERPAATVELMYEGEAILVQSDDVVVGRTAGCTVRVVHPLVSREHCRLEPRADGLFVVDLHAVNGTWLNGVRIEGRTQARAGDRIGLGREGAVLVVQRAIVDGVDVSRRPHEEDQKTMVAGDPRAAGKVARVEVAVDALPALGYADEPTTRAANVHQHAAATGEASIPVAAAIQTSEIGEEGTTTGEAAVAVRAAPPARRGFMRGFAIGVAIGLAAVALLATCTHALDALGAHSDKVAPR
jgi:pSer/pThr/pTyr-binding forkhead associated (FHA) protein